MNKSKTFKCQSCGGPVQYNDKYCPHCHCTDPGFLRELSNYTAVGAILSLFVSILLSVLLGFFLVYPWLLALLKHNEPASLYFTILCCFLLFFIPFCLFCSLYRRFFLNRKYEKYKAFLMNANGDDVESMVNWVEKAQSNTIII